MTRAYTLFVLLCVLLAMFFHHGRGFNVSSRLLTVYGIVEDGHLYADRWKGETGDYAEIDKHIYSDKAPLTSFMALPIYWVYRTVANHKDQTEFDKELISHLGTVLVSALPLGLFLLMVLIRLLKEGMPPRRAVWTALLLGYGTSLLVYGSVMFSHMLAATLLVAAYVLAVEREERFVLAGFLGSSAVLAEYPMLLTQAILFGYLLLGPDRKRRAGLYGLGAAPMAVAMFAYNKAITGKWLDFPYNHVPDMWAQMKTHFGMRLPDPSAAWELAFGQYRGMAFYAPALLLLAPMAALHFAGPERRRRLVLVLCLTYFGLIASYFKWDGGWCTGPRHLAPVMALALYEGAAALATRTRGWVAFALLSTWGMVLNLAALSTSPMPGEGDQHPAWEVFFPKLMKGELNDHNLLHEVGLPQGRYLFAMWLLTFAGGALFCGWAVARSWARRAPPAPPAPSPALPEPAPAPAAPAVPAS
jgi:hypothetical protein